MRKGHTEFKVCIGSTCFSRGSNQTLSVLKDLLDGHEKESFVSVIRTRCFNQCISGPIVMIGRKMYEEVTEDKISGILHKELDQ